MGLKLLVLSMEARASAFTLHVLMPEIPAALGEWAARHAPNVLLHTLAPDARGWAVKAEVLLYMLDRVEEVIWLDADLLALDDPRRFFRTLGPRGVVVAQEFYKDFDTSPGFAEAWGYERVRALAHQVNSCVLRVTREHRRLLECWRENVLSGRFVRFQEMDPMKRPAAFYGDQEALEGLLSSDQEDFSQFPVAFVETGPDLIHDHRHFYSYAAKDRLRNAFGRQQPAFVHCIGFRPWMDDYRDLQGEMMYEALQFKPYVRCAERYREQIEEDVREWIDYSTPYGRLWRALTLDDPHLQGFAMWVLEKATRLRPGGA